MFDHAQQMGNEPFPIDIYTGVQGRVRVESGARHFKDSESFLLRDSRESKDAESYVS